MKRREMKLLLEERFERIALLETRIDTMDQLVEGYRAREQAILDTLQSTKERTAKMLADAEAETEQTRAKAKAESEELVRLVKEEAERTLRTARAEAQQELAAAKSEAERMRASAKAEADALLTDASAVSGSLRADAEKRTAELVAIAKADSDRMLRDVEIIKREYEEMVETFNAMLAQNATELEVTAARFAEFVKDRKIDPPEIRMDGDAFYKSVGVLNDAALPDASENPAMLMQNIYRIQNRPLPEDFLEERAAGRDESEEKTAREFGVDPQAGGLSEQTNAEQIPKFPMEDGSGADDRQAVVEPYSEAAWVNEAQQSESEPQAEFTKAFENTFDKSDFVVHPDACQLTQENATEAFDAAFATPSFAAGAAAFAIPASIKDDVASHAETEQLFDEIFSGQFDPSGKLAQDAVEPQYATGPEGAKPEPFSETAWAASSFTSDLEPQAEGALFSGEVEREVAPAAGESVPVADAENVIDDYFANFSAFGPTTTATTPEPSAKPEPYSETAWAASSFTSDLEPQAEGALFSGEVEPTTKPASQTVNSYDTAAASAFDSYFPSFETNTTPETEPAAKPEPYSETAWATGSFTSDLEPQAEGNLYTEAEEEEPAPAPRQYNEYGQVREWEPEPEPDMDDVPTVSRYMGRSEPDGEISLDDLLDEIIKAGE